MAYAENASSWVGTLLGDIIKAPEGGEKEVRQRERISARAGTPSGGYCWFRKVERTPYARGRGYRPGQGLRRGIQLRFREMAKSIAAGPELACGSDS